MDKRFEISGVLKKVPLEIPIFRQTKGAATDRFSPRVRDACFLLYPAVYS